MTGDCHAGIWGSPGVKSPRATRLATKQQPSSSSDIPDAIVHRGGGRARSGNAECRHPAAETASAFWHCESALTGVSKGGRRECNRGAASAGPRRSA